MRNDVTHLRGRRAPEVYDDVGVLMEDAAWLTPLCSHKAFAAELFSITLNIKN